MLDQQISLQFSGRDLCKSLFDLLLPHLLEDAMEHMFEHQFV